MVLLNGGEPPANAAGLKVNAFDGDYDSLVAQVEAADKAVVW